MNRSSWGTIAGSILLGLLLGLAIRKNRLPADPDLVAARGSLPSKERIGTALLRSEIRDLEARMASVREEGERFEQERLRLAALEKPEPPSPEARLRLTIRQLLEERSMTIDGDIIEWLKKDPAHIQAMLRIGAEVFREKDWGRLAARNLAQFFYYHTRVLEGVEREKAGVYLSLAQRTETDSLVRGWMLNILDELQVALPADQVAELAQAFRDSKDSVFRSAVFGIVLRDSAAYADLIRETIRQGSDLDERCRCLLKAWDKRGLPGNELRAMARELMKSDNPSLLIMDAQDWVPKYINPLAPQDTISLFDQTLSKPIEPVHKAISLMVMGSIASLFPGHPGRAEIDRFAAATDDKRLKEYAGRIGGMIDEGKSYADIRKLNPLEFGMDFPK